MERKSQATVDFRCSMLFFKGNGEKRNGWELYKVSIIYTKRWTSWLVVALLVQAVVLLWWNPICLEHGFSPRVLLISLQLNFWCLDFLPIEWYSFKFFDVVCFHVVRKRLIWGCLQGQRYKDFRIGCYQSYIAVWRGKAFQYLYHGFFFVLLGYMLIDCTPKCMVTCIFAVPFKCLRVNTYKLIIVRVLSC